MIFTLIAVTNAFLSEPQSVMDNVDLRISKIYPNAANLDQEYLQDGDLMDYAFFEKIGSGAFSDVYLGKRHSDEKIVVLKHIRNGRMKIINKEISILQAMRGARYSVQLVDAIRGDDEATLIFPYETQQSFIHIQRLRTDMKKYFYQLFYVLNEAHSRGVMHRDIKGSNILINQDEIILIDWGLSAFYVPLRDQSTRMGTRYYKAPELLLQYKYYDYSIDIWAAGCMFADFIFQVHPLFKGKDNTHQLHLIVEMLGLNDFQTYLRKYSINTNLTYEVTNNTDLDRFDLHRLINQNNKHFATEEAIDLLNRILVYDHQERITAAQILEHPYFAGSDFQFV